MLIDLMHYLQIVAVLAHDDVFSVFVFRELLLISSICNKLWKSLHMLGKAFLVDFYLSLVQLSCFRFLYKLKGRLNHDGIPAKELKSDSKRDRNLPFLRQDSSAFSYQKLCKRQSIWFKRLYHLKEIYGLRLLKSY